MMGSPQGGAMYALVGDSFTYSIISAVVGKRAAVVREELEAYIKKNEAALAALQSDQEEASSDTDERLAAATLALAATKEALQVREALIKSVHVGSSHGELLHDPNLT